MSRLSDILGVKEGQKFRYDNKDSIFKVEGNFVKYKENSSIWSYAVGTEICIFIAHPENIHPILQLTEQQITAIKGRIAEGTPWVARDGGEKYVYFYGEKPKLSEGKTYFYTDEDDGISHSDLYDFITFENSPVYLPELVEG